MTQIMGNSTVYISLEPISLFELLKLGTWIGHLKSSPVADWWKWVFNIAYWDQNLHFEVVSTSWIWENFLMSKHFPKFLENGSFQVFVPIFQNLSKTRLSQFSRLSRKLASQDETTDLIYIRVVCNFKPSKKSWWWKDT